MEYSNLSDGELNNEEQKIRKRLEELKTEMLKDIDELELLESNLFKIYKEYNTREN